MGFLRVQEGLLGAFRSGRRSAGFAPLSHRDMQFDGLAVWIHACVQIPNLNVPSPHGPRREASRQQAAGQPDTGPAGSRPAGSRPTGHEATAGSGRKGVHLRLCEVKSRGQGLAAEYARGGGGARKRVGN